MSTIKRFGLVGLVVALSVLSTASAQWEVISLRHPDEQYYYSHAFGISGSQQVGDALVAGNFHAALWSGTPESFVDLHPDGTSAAYATSGGQQVGSVYVGSGHNHASLWSGTAESWVDLHPAGYATSRAYDVADGQQVGAAYMWEAGILSAGVWSGTAESWVDLNPPGSTESSAYGVAGGRQVGYATIGGSTHAGLWSGTAASFLDLHVLLEPEYSRSEARAIDVFSGDIWVAGTAYREEIPHAMLWHYTVPEPSSIAALAVIFGMAIIGRIRRRNVV